MTPTDPVDRLLASAAPEAPADPDTQALVATLAAAIVDAGPSGRVIAVAARRRSKRRPAFVVGTTLTTVVAVAAAGYGIGARTGLFGDPGQTESDTTEWLDSSAADFGDVAATLLPDDLELPGWADWQAAVDHVVRQGQDSPGLVQETGVRASYETYAQCSWLSEWATDQAAGDTAGATEAAAAYEAQIDRPVVVAVDGGGGRERMQAMVDSMAAADADAVAYELDLNCPADLAARAGATGASGAGR